MKIANAAFRKICEKVQMVRSQKFVKKCKCRVPENLWKAQMPRPWRFTKKRKRGDPES